MSTATASTTGGTATLNGTSGQITHDATGQVPAKLRRVTLLNSSVATSSIVLVSIARGTATKGVPTLCEVIPASGSVTISYRNTHALDALDGTVVLSFTVTNP